MIEVIFHCSSSSFGNAALIDFWHRSRPRPFKMIGYHLVGLNGWIDSRHFNERFDGKVETGRPFDGNDVISANEWGAHTRGKNNQIGYCLIGKSGQFTQKQLEAAGLELQALKKQFGEVTISQHSNHDPLKPYCAGLTEDQINYLQSFIS